MARAVTSSPAPATGADGAAGTAGAPDLASSDAALHGSISRSALARLMARLKWTLWKRSFRKNTGKIIGTAIGLLYGIGGLGAVLSLMAGALFGGGDGPLFPLLVRGLGAAALLAWLLVPLLAFGLDDTLDPRRFALLPRRARELQVPLFVASLVSLPALFTVIAAAIVTVFEAIWMLTAGLDPLPMVAGLVALIPANLAGIALCLLLPRAILAHSAVRTTSRRAREIGGVLGIVIVLAVAYGASIGLQSLARADLDRLVEIARSVVRVATSTPLGALFSVPLDLAEGHVIPALLRALIGAAAIWGVWLWWRRSIDLAMRSALVGEASSGAAKVSPLVPRGVKPSAFGAVMGRSLRYWKRDARYLASIAIMPVMLIFFVAMSLVLPESGFMGITGLLLVAGLSGISLMNEYGFDGPAGWVNLTAGLDPKANVRGRIAAMAVLAAPFLLVMAVAIPLLAGAPEQIGVTVLGTMGLMLGGWGAASLIGTLLPYPTAAPGTSPMKDRSASSANAMIAVAVGMLAVTVPQLPAAAVVVWGLVTGSSGIVLVGGVLSLLTGIVLLVVGVGLAERRLERRYPDLFQKVRAHV